APFFSAGGHQFDVGTDGSLYVPFGGGVRKYAANGTDLGSVVTSQEGIQSTAIGPDGNIYLAVGYPLQHINVFDGSGNALATIGEKGFAPGRFVQIFSMTVASDGTLIVMDAALKRIQKFKPVAQADGTRAIIVAAGGLFPG